MALLRFACVVLITVGCQSAVPSATPFSSATPSLSPTAVTTPSNPSAPTSSPSFEPIPPQSPPTASSSLTPTAAPRITLLIDTDVAPDDLVAISFLVSSPNVSIEAITVAGTGEVHCPRGVEIVLALLERLAAPEIPVACGDATPTSLDHAFPDALRQNADRAAGLDLPATTRTPAAGDAVQLIETTASAGPGQLRILTLGPLTNIAQVLADDAGFAAHAESVYIMGGAVDVPGNLAIPGVPGAPTDNSAAEWNIYADPAAAQAVLDSGIPVLLVSLDGTNQVPVTSSLVARAGSGRASPALGVLAELFDKNSYMTSSSYYLWDTVAAIAAAGYPVADFTAVDLSVDVSEGTTSGATRRGEGPANASYMTRADAAAIEDVIVSVMGAD